MSRRHIIVSNRLPLTWNNKQQLFERSSGGVVSAIADIHQDNLYWFGYLPEHQGSDRQLNRSDKKNPIHFKNIDIPAKIYDNYYNGYCNRILWPLFHYEVERCHYHNDYWQAYEQANQYFCRALIKFVKPGDTIWIHDYQLCLLPALLRKKLHNCPIGFFLHIPFPSSEIFQQLPQRKQLLQSILAADLVGFQDYHYLRHFCSSASRLLETDNNGLHIHYNQRFIELGVFPVSVDGKKIIRHSQRRAYIPYNDDCFTFLGVDRLDYIKGLDIKLDAFDRLLATQPQLHSKIRLCQIATPTRSDIPEYQQLKQQIDEKVGEINGKYATTNWTPIHYLTRNLDHNELIPLYRNADALLVTSKRDGFNLVAVEYLLSQSADNPGVLLLSEFTGAFSQLRNCLPLNPWDSEALINAMISAIAMPLSERKARWQGMFDYAKQYSSTQWAQSFLNRLAAREHYFTDTIKPSDPSLTQLRTLFKKQGWHKKCRLILFLDYDGTLVPIVNDPEKALLPKTTQQLLQQLIDCNIEINILSGRKKRFLAQQFEQINATLVAEHGAFLYNSARKKWRDQIKQCHSWVVPTCEIMTDYVNRVPHSTIEKKNYAIVWHYRKSPPDYSTFQAYKLYHELKLHLQNEPVVVMHGKKTIEVKHMQANKARFIQQRIADTHDEPADFYIAIGDDMTDEDMFDAIRRAGISIKVVHDHSLADIHLSEQSQAIKLLENLTRL
ncbi:MAG: bifunctional alpha,alpha-trehalose-phosphate synthase (UDP-forming)/trehalose-phosphatase [Gammaproteobacteria bacterium]|nr:bifunctional alpha,alpha-trehalose-phosphate synthase (UDP-forming)/trehalose-phosphatase [Gammaproteobacteria bacterium]